MDDRAIRWTLDGFVQHFDFVHHKMPDHRYTWVLGAGASKASGIPLGTELVDRWLSDLHLRESDGTILLEQWATEENLGIVGFKYAERAGFYPKIYQRRFREYADEGFAYLESIMSGKDPSPGYSILAAALAGTSDHVPRHNAVVTTNFDNLVADALSIYTDVFPFVCGHESLTGFVRVAMRRPLICKIHRDLLLAPQNDSRSLRRLHDSWGSALRALFQSYTPLVIGYGGNDDTLMDLLESMQPGDIKGQLVWCYYEGGEPNERIVNLVTDLRGILVPVPDFDLLMVLLGDKMNIQILDQEIGRRASERTERYRERIQRLDTVRHPNVARALAATLDRSGGWWAWDRKANLEKDLNRREIVYRQGIQQCPQDGRLHSVFADFLARPLGDHDEAERMYRKAMELDAKNAFVIIRFADFQAYVRRDYSEAERLFRKAIEFNPDDPAAACRFADFLFIVRRDLDEAERLYRKAIELDPQSTTYAWTQFALFLRLARRADDEADRHYRQALELDPNDSIATVEFAYFQAFVRGDYAEADGLFLKALELAPEEAYVARLAARFQAYVRRDRAEAERLYRKAIELDSEDVVNMAELAEFLRRLGNDGEAERILRKALKIDPKNSFVNAVAATYFEVARNDLEKSEKCYQKAIEIDPLDSDYLCMYANFLAYSRDKHEEAEPLYRRAMELDSWDPDHPVSYATWLLARGRSEEAGEMIEKAGFLNANRRNEINAVLALYRAALARIEGREDSSAIKGLQTLLAEDYPRLGAIVDRSHAVRQVLVRLPAEDRQLYSALVDAVLDPEKDVDIDALLQTRASAIASGNGKFSDVPLAYGDAEART